MIGSVAAWGRRHGISREAARKRVADHQIPKTADGKIDFDEADRIWNASLNPLQQQRGATQAKATTEAKATEAKPTDETTGISSLAAAQLARERIRIEREGLALRREKLETVDLAAVNGYVAGMIIKARDVFLRMPGELRDRLAAESDAVNCESIVAAEVQRGLRELAEYRPNAK